MMPSRSEFERLALPHLDAAYTLAFWLLRSRPDAEDVVQEAYLRALRAFANFRGDAFRPWLLAIVRNAAYRELGRRKQSAAVVSLDEFMAHGSADGLPTRIAAELTDTHPGAEAMLVRDAEDGYLRRALAQLPETYREVILLREIEEMSYREIAQVIGAPEGTVMSRLSRGRSELREILIGMMAKDEGHAV